MALFDTNPLRLSLTSNVGLAADDCFDFINGPSDDDLVNMFGDDSNDMFVGTDVAPIADDDCCSQVTYDSNSVQYLLAPFPPTATTTSQLNTPQPNKTINHGYNPKRGNKRCKNLRDIKNSQAAYGTSYNFEEFQASCSDFKKPEAKKPMKKRVVSCNEITGYDFSKCQEVAGIINRPAKKRRVERRVTVDSIGSSHQEASSLKQTLQMDMSMVLKHDQVLQALKSAAQNSSSTSTSLQKLAESMQRTELSRRQLAMHRGLPSQQQPHQQQSQQPLFPSAEQVQQYDALDTVAQKLQQNYRAISTELGNDKASMLSAFFNGKRSTLTNELEHSRRQLQMYGNMFM